MEDGIVTIYEADTNPNANIGEDILDIRGMAKTIDILSEEDTATVLGTIEEDHSVKLIVDAILASLVEPGSRDPGRGRYFLDFRRTAGTSVVQPFWMETGELGRDIMTGPVVAQSLRSAVAQQPPGTAGP